MKDLSPYFISRSQLSNGSDELDPIFLDPEEEGGIDLVPYWRALRKHIRLIIGVVAVSLLLTIIYVESLTPRYMAQTTVLIRAHAPEIYQPKESVASDQQAAVDPDFFRTQCALLRSKLIALDVIRRLDLAHNRGFTADAGGVTGGIRGAVGTLVSGISSLFVGGRSRNNKIPYASDEEERLVGAYQGALSVSAVPETSIVRIGFAATSPELAAKIANAHAQAFIRQGIRFKSQTNEEAETFLRNKLGELRQRLEDSEIALNRYRREKGIIPGLMSLNGREGVVVDRLTDLSKDLTAAQVKRISLEAQVDMIRRGHYDSLPSVTRNAGIQTLQGQLDTFQAQYASMSKEFTPNYPPVAQLRAKIDRLKESLREQMREQARSIKSAYDAAVEQQTKLQHEMDRQRSLALHLNDAAVKYAILQRDVDTNRQLYNSVLQRMKDVGVAAEAQTSNASVVDRAMPPSEPTSPKKTQDVLLALILSLTVSVGLAIGLEYIDDTLETSEEAEGALRLPNLSSIPDFALPYANDRRINQVNKPLQIDVETSGGKELVNSAGLNSLIGESYRHLRTALMVSRAESPPRVTMITSATRGEGKTVTAVNTAIVLAQFEGRVLLIDGDLRKGRCHQMLGVGKGVGLTEVLTGSLELEDVVSPTSVSRLFFLGSGCAAPNPTELLGSRKMRDTLRILREQFQYIVIDSPPVMPVTDAIVMSTMVDGVVVVVRAGETSRKYVKSTCARLRQAHAKIFGTVLNKMQVQSSDYTQYYNYSADAEEAQGSGSGV